MASILCDSYVVLSVYEVLEKLYLLASTPIGIVRTRRGYSVIAPGLLRHAARIGKWGVALQHLVLQSILDSEVYESLPYSS
jgi:hypothetical protein